MDLREIRKRLDELERLHLSSLAVLSCDAVREKQEERLETGHRLWFSVDADRILHSLAYTRYVDKTQVFSLIPNDHLTHRVLHVQLVSKIARTIGRFLRLNLDLIEAIALGHDIGHPPFGHDGEMYLSELCENHGLPPFIHSIQGVHFLRNVEKKGRGCNLSLQVLDGILCHDGETHCQYMSPERGKNFGTLQQEIEKKYSDPSENLVPMTLEGCVVRMTDVIAYIGRDIEDAVRLNLITRDQIPVHCRNVLGTTNGTIVYRLVEDLIEFSLDQDRIGFSSRISDALAELKAFNMENIYKNPKIKTESVKIKRLYGLMYEEFLEDLADGRKESMIFRDFLDGMDEKYLNRHTHAEIVRDFMAGMTDAYFLRTGRAMLVPRWLPSRF
ncbi:MAG TPA: HD domain-containing protein [Thermodesulfobacteriaceae bacterium]|nr:HD domain-containing protein [Thermodesulfobacteriaceae bacterium]